MKKMRPVPVAFSDVTAIVKANLSGWYMLLALLLFSLFMSGCDIMQQEEEEKLDGCFPTTDCVLQGTAVTIACGYGAFQNTWLQLNDTTYLQPWVNATAVQTLKPGQKYSFGYIEVERDNRYDNIYTCMAALPKAKIIKLTCLQPVAGTAN
ncbi:hypothetical protein [Pontibacter fetidus]|uniref:Uncharacterized protein n=1 Tax=Pontibacter fetidus TaxID=2700082 RepID=A0A6B2H9B9_9BACT|nr:hypothetical protein [Pontibacter fetidus]NDK56102.1 hypothetical protein [Pontibacter fetidus]